MAIVVDKARPAATTTPDGSVKFAQSLADPRISPLYGPEAPVITGAFPATDDRGNPDTTIDWTQAGTDLDRP